MRAIVLLVALMACKPGPPEYDTAVGPVTVRDGMLTTTTWSTSTDGSGRLEVPVEVGVDTTSFLVSLSTKWERPVLLSIHAPSGDVVFDAEGWLGSDEVLTGAIEVARRTAAVNWPAREVDGPLVPGTWRTVWESTRKDRVVEPDVPTEVTVMTKEDPDLTRGTVTVRLVWAEGVAEQPSRRAEVEAAVDRWAIEWARYGLEVAATFHASSMDPSLPFTDSGSFEVTEIAEEVADPGDIVVFLGDTMAYKPGVFGTAASTPGSPYPGRYHFVVIALDMFIGPSGAISDDARQALVDVLAHETSHFMGLPHVVSQEWDRWDALADTPRCTSRSDCEQKLGTNLMFPFLYCPSSCPSRWLSPEQQGVLHRYVGTR